MAIKELKTKIALKQNTYEYWTTSNATTVANKTHADYVPLYGEVCFCEIKTGESVQQTVPPTVLFKVGNGATPFKLLNWASALAADVFDWAKCQYVALNGTNLEFYNQTGDASTKTVKHQVDLSKFALASSVGTLSALSTTKKGNLVEAINEVLQAINAGGKGSLVSVTKEETPTAGSHSSYTLKQGDTTLTPKIEIPEVTVSKLATPTAGSQATYEIKQGGTAATTKIEIPNVTVPEIPSITITDDTSVETPTGDTVSVYKNLTANGHTLTEELVSVPTKEYVDKKAAGAVDYLGTLSATSGLSTTAGKGDFYRVTTEIKSGDTILAFVGDLVVAEKDKPSQAIDGTNWTAIHCGDGDISNVTAGNGLTGGGATGSVTLSAKAGNHITVNSTGINHGAKPTSGTKETASTGSGRTYVTEVLVDTYGHVAGVKTATESVTDTNTWRNINVFAGVEGSKASVALKGTGITTGSLDLKAGTGLKWTATANTNDATIDIDDTVEFILNCN